MAGSQPGGSPKEIPSNLTMEELEKLAITKALDQCEGNRTHAAERLDIFCEDVIHRRKLTKKLSRSNRTTLRSIITTVWRW